MAVTAPPPLARRRRRAAAATLPPLLSLLLLIAAAPTTTQAASPPSDLLSAAAALAPWIISVRRQLHAIPELMWEEAKTSAALAKHLDDLKIPFKRYAKTGLVGTVGTGKPPIVALRSDIDALPVDEPDGLEFRSAHEGRMHACGHDGKAYKRVWERFSFGVFEFWGGGRDAYTKQTKQPNNLRHHHKTKATCRCCWAPPSS